MKRFIKLVCQRIARISFIFFAILIVSILEIHAQDKQSITGKLIDRINNQAVPYANVALIKSSDSTLINNTISDENGLFNISPAPFGSYRLFVSIIGYKPVIKDIVVVNKGMIDAGNIFLQDTALIIKETIVVGERTKAKSESDKTTFFMTKKILDASSTGTDVLKLIPGIQVDFMQNIALEGSQNIQILVDGKERDRSFINQLNPKEIEKIEVISKPSSNYDGNITGVINIILKKERDSGINGQIYAEIPTSGSEIFIHPTYTLNCGFKKLNLFTSYNGEMIYLDQHENNFRKVWNSSDTNRIVLNQNVRQKNWSHRFNYGFDYFFNAQNQLNFYAFYNPYSQELDGNADLKISGYINNNQQAKREDTDMNTSSFYSLYYKHNFDTAGREITFDISHYSLKTENSTTYTYEGNEKGLVTQANAVKPEQNEISLKMDFTTPIWNRLKISTGTKAKFQALQDRNTNDFHYNEKIYAIYGTISYKQIKFDLSAGLRAEKSVSILKNNFRNPALSFFPYSILNYKLTSRQNIQLSYNRSIIRPNIYQLNPYTSIDNPYSLSKGNPFLKSEFLSSIFFEHSLQFKSNYFATRLFYNKLTDAINNLTFINDTGAFETQIQNLGDIHQYGVQFLGSVKMGIVTINPYLRLYNQSTSGNCLEEQYVAKNMHSQGFESSLSSVISFKHDLAFSLVFQYASPKYAMQGKTFCDALYFLSIEKTFKQKIKVGIVSVIPFTKSFTYQGSEIEGSNFYTRYEGNVIVSKPFLFLKLSYQFNSGKNRDGMNREKEEIENLKKKGF